MNFKAATKTFEGTVVEGDEAFDVNTNVGSASNFVSRQLADFNNKKVKIEVTVKITEVE